jgi:hypothetical protein
VDAIDGRAVSVGVAFIPTGIAKGDLLKIQSADNRSACLQCRYRGAEITIGVTRMLGLKRNPKIDWRLLRKFDARAHLGR